MDDLQSFSPLRFAVPDAMGHRGVVLVVDPDVFAVGDVGELFARDRVGLRFLGLEGAGVAAILSASLLLAGQALAARRWLRAHHSVAVPSR